MKILNWIGQFLTKRNSIVLFCLCFTIGKIFHTQTLFYRIYPAEMETREIGSYFFSFGFEFVLLLCIVNSKQKGLWSMPGLMSFCTFITSVFFFKTFELGTDIYLKIFLSLIIGVCDYTLADLFQSKFKEEMNLQSVMDDLRKQNDELMVTIETLKGKLSRPKKTETI